jgi:hypothetical protein
MYLLGDGIDIVKKTTLNATCKEVDVEVNAQKNKQTLLFHQHNAGQNQRVSST